MKDLTKYYKQIRDSARLYKNAEKADWRDIYYRSLMEDYDKWIKEQREYWNTVSAMEFACCSLVHKHIKEAGHEQV